MSASAVPNVKDKSHMDKPLVEPVLDPKIIEAEIRQHMLLSPDHIEPLPDNIIQALTDACITHTCPIETLSRWSVEELNEMNVWGIVNVFRSVMGKYFKQIGSSFTDTETAPDISNSESGNYIYFTLKFNEDFTTSLYIEYFYISKRGKTKEA